MTAPFRFKQFTIRQDRCAMKVGTDGILIGAWASACSPLRILDIGTGTGLIAMMLAQRYPSAKVDAIEVDSPAFQQAEENFRSSAFSDRLKIHHCSLDTFQAESANHGRYSLIVSNPPWFVDSLKSGTRARDIARHVDAMSSGKLLQAVLTLLGEQGQFAVIQPIESRRSLQTQASTLGLHCSRSCDVHPTPEKSAKRTMLQFDREIQTTPLCEEKLVVETSVRHVYTEEFRALTKEFYLRF